MGQSKLGCWAGQKKQEQMGMDGHCGEGFQRLRACS
jgi:hypothetical protein